MLNQKVIISRLRHDLQIVAIFFVIYVIVYFVSKNLGLAYAIKTVGII